MMPAEVRRRVAMIESIKDDDESAHAAEDRLYKDVLCAIAEGCRNPSLLAATALVATDIEFARWCA